MVPFAARNERPVSCVESPQAFSLREILKSLQEILKSFRSHSLDAVVNAEIKFKTMLFPFFLYFLEHDSS